MTALLREIATLRLDGTETTIVFAWTDGVPWIAHFGPRLPDATDLATLAALANRPLPHAAVDLDEAVSLHPEAGRAFKGQPALSGWRPGQAGGWGGRFSFEKASGLPDGEVFRLTDKPRGLALELECRIDADSNVARFVSRLTNLGDTDFTIEWLSAPVIAPPQHFSEAISFHGRWCGEFATERSVIAPGLKVSESRAGRTSHGSFPGMILAGQSTGEDEGECIGLHLGWSGNHRIVLERLSTGDVQVQMGAQFLPGEGKIASGATMETPPLYVTHSAAGFNRMSQNMHAHVRSHVLKFPVPGKPRPVTVNIWEAIYFSHTEDRLKEIVDTAADIGAERFVIDDGWFAGRNDDTTSLGDWFADKAKYPGGLQPIADYIRSKGMEFGLWVEPEMVNEKSDLYREHPDWVLRLPDYPLITGRNQLVLDISRPEVSDYLFERLSTLVRDHDIAYFKWDMNRDLILPGGADGDAAAYRQVMALYGLIDRLHEAFPKLEIESCASGGGRVDYGILERVQRFWPSDSNDPVERMRIQYGFSYFLPPEVMGSHIGPSWSHTSGRGTHAGLRALAASYGHMGIEADLTKMSGHELEKIREAVALYKADRAIWHDGLFHRINTVDPALVGAMAISPDGGAARIVLAQLDHPRSTMPPRIRIPGLIAEKAYRVRLAMASEMLERGSRRPTNQLAGDGMIVSGAALAAAGIGVPAPVAQTGMAIAIDATERANG